MFNGATTVRSVDGVSGFRSWLPQLGQPALDTGEGFMMGLEAAQPVAGAGEQGRRLSPARRLPGAARLGQDIKGELEVGDGDVAVLLAEPLCREPADLLVQLPGLCRLAFPAPCGGEHREQLAALAVAGGADLLEPVDGAP